MARNAPLLVFSPMTTTTLFMPVQKSTAVKQDLHPGARTIVPMEAS